MDFMPTVTANNYEVLTAHDKDDHDSDDDDDDDDDEDEYEPNEEKKAVNEKAPSRNQRKKEAAKKLKKTMLAMEAEDLNAMEAEDSRISKKKADEHHQRGSSEAPTSCGPAVPCFEESVPTAAVNRKRKPKAKVRFMTKPTEDVPIPCTHGCCNLSVKQLGESQEHVQPPMGELAGGHIGLFEYQHEEELNAVFEEVEIEVANDSGSCAHVVGPDQVPSTVEIKKSADCKNFTGAGGDGIKNHGKAEVALVMEDGRVINNVVQVAEVTRALHSTGLICDTKKEVLFTETEAVVVPAGTLSKYLGMIKRIAEYKRKGGLYVAKMKIRKRVSPNSPKAAPFGRPGDNR